MFCILFLLTLSFAVQFDLDNSEDILYKQWKNTFSKSYNTPSEELMRKTIFMKKLKEIRSFNKESTTYKKTLTRFSDLTTAERDLVRNGGMVSKKAMLRNKQRKQAPKKSLYIPSGEPPSSYTICGDDATMDHCGSINFDQGYCGCCYVAGVGHQLQMMYANLTYEKTGTATYAMPSVQQLIDCTVDWSGCGGGLSDNSIMSNQYVSMASDYAFEDYNVGETDSEINQAKHTCQTGKETPLKFTNVYSFSELSRTELKNVIYEYGSFITAMYVTDNFLEYDGTTIFQEESCNNEVTNHVVVVDGYGVSGEVEYLWVRNSWGSSWGLNNGHFRISMGSLCGINGNDNGDYEVNFVVDVELTDDGTEGSYGSTWSTGTNDNDNDDYAVTGDGDGIDVSIYTESQVEEGDYYNGSKSNSIIFIVSAIFFLLTFFN
ncbi:Xylem cysteine proteinase 2 precursor [Entamoeba marina]